MCHKIRCDGKFWKLFGFESELNKACANRMLTLPVVTACVCICSVTRTVKALWPGENRIVLLVQYSASIYHVGNWREMRASTAMLYSTTNFFSARRYSTYIHIRTVYSRCVVSTDWASEQWNKGPGQVADFTVPTALLRSCSLLNGSGWGGNFNLPSQPRYSWHRATTRRHGSNVRSCEIKKPLRQLLQLRACNWRLDGRRPMSGKKVKEPLGAGKACQWQCRVGYLHLHLHACRIPLYSGHGWALWNCLRHRVYSAVLSTPSVIKKSVVLGFRTTSLTRFVETYNICISK